MAIFAIYPKTTEQSNIESVEECHLNLWVLPALLGRKKFLVEVGMTLNPRVTISGIEIVLPFRVMGNPVDLADHIQNDRSIQRLLFTKESNYPTSYARLSPTPQITEGKHFTKLVLAFDSNLSSGIGSYLRFRAEVQDFGNRLQWRRAFGISTGATLDLRVSDLRELSHNEELHSRNGAILPIKVLRLFMITPVWIHYRYSSPPAHYLRLIESAGWEKYLNRKCHLGRAFSICQLTANEISRDTPFRGYIDYERSVVDTLTRISFLFLVLGLLVGALLLVGIYCLQYAGPVFKDHLIKITSSPLYSAGLPISLLVTAFLIRQIIKAMKMLPGRWRIINKFLYSLDNWLLADPCFGRSRRI